MKETTNYKVTVAASQKNKERDYWLAKMSGELVKSYFPYDDQSAKDQGGRAECVSLVMDRDVFSPLLRLVSGSDNRLHMALTAVLAILLNKYTGNCDIIMGSTVWRQAANLNFINTELPLRFTCHHHITFKELLLQVKQTILAAVEHQNYPINILMNQLGIGAPDRETSLFDVALLVENIHDKNYFRFTRPNMIFSFLRTADGLEGNVEYNAHLYDPVAVERIITHFIRVLTQVLANPGIKISAVQLISGEEKQEILQVFNKPNYQEAYPEGTLVHDLFQRQVEKNPNNLAVECHGRQITFRELNRKANQLAVVLRKQGIGPGSIAALLFDWTLDMVTAVMGVLKSGAAYLPIEPEYPWQRISAILEDSHVSLLLTTSTLVEKFSFTILQGLHIQKVEPYLTAPRPGITNLDSLPVAHRSLVDYEKYSQYIGQASVKETYITLLGTRGCPYNCAYCHKIWPRKHVFRSAENIFAELRLFYDMGVRRFAMTDDIFNLNMENSRRFFRLIIEKGLKVQLFFPNGMRGDILTKDYIDLMVEAGVVNVALALETASPRLQKLIGKNLNIEKLRENVAYICRHHPQLILELCIMHGFPTETQEEAMMTLDFLKQMRWVHMPYFNVLRIYRNTDMERIAMDQGVRREEIYKWEEMTFGDIPDFLPFDKSFTMTYRTNFLNDYFLLKERLLHVLPYQMKVYTEEELVQKYDSYLPVDIKRFDDLLAFTGITQTQLQAGNFLEKERVYVPHMNEKIRIQFPTKQPAPGALRILLLDASQFFSSEGEQFYDVFDPPLGLMYLLTCLNRQLGSRVNGKIAKSRVDYDSFDQLKNLIMQFKPDVIGLRTLSIYRDFFHKTAELIRLWGWEVPIVAGGPYASSSKETVLQDRHIDLVVIGEGEVTFCELIEKMLDNNNKLPSEEVLKRIPGIAFIPEQEKRRAVFARQVIRLDRVEDILEQKAPANLSAANRPTDPAYVIYTSGSTGMPKGIMVQHRSFTDFTAWAVQEFEHRAGYRVLLSNSYASDGAIQQIFPPLISGGTLHLLHTDVRLDPTAYVSYLHENRINNIDEVPVVMNAIFDSLPMDEKKELLPDLTNLSLGSEFVPVEVARKCRKYLNHQGKIINAYGPAETSVETCTYHFDGRSGTEKSSIGKPRRNLNLYILDPLGNLCPPGVPGEICISGIGVADGYLNNPELTALKFVPNSFKHTSHFSRLYRTGDRGSWLVDGNICFLGRLDFQVNIRGNRIAVEEIENYLVNHPDVNDAIVMPKDKPNGEKYICAYIILKAHKNPGIKFELKDYLVKKLPDFMIPGSFVYLERFPLTPNGKLDRKVLSRMDEGSMESDLEVVPPWNARQRKMIRIWAEVLGKNETQIGIESDYFALGGHSLNAIHLLSKIHREFHTRIPLSSLFKVKTVHGLEELIKESRREEFEHIPAVEKKEYHDLSSAQRRIYFLQQMNPGSIGYNIPVTVKLEGEVNRSQLERTFRMLIHRHESLRTSFPVVKGEPVQVIHGRVDFNLVYCQGTIDTTQGIIDSMIISFDLGRAPLIRAALIDIGHNQAILLMDIHHIGTDGVSSELLIEDFMNIYQEKELPVLRLRYKDFTEWQNRMLEKGAIKLQEEYWLTELQGVLPVLDLPTDFERPPVQSFEGTALDFKLNAGQTTALRDLARKAGVTLYMLLLAVFNILLSRLSSQEDIILGTPTAGRNHSNLEPVIGMFVNTLVLRNYILGDLSFREFLDQVKEKTLSAFENQDYPFDELVSKIVDQPDVSRNPIFSVGFGLESIKKFENRIFQQGIGNITVKPYRYQWNTSKIDLSLNGMEMPDDIEFYLEYSTCLFKPETIRRFVQYFKEIISIILQNRKIKIKDIPIDYHLLKAEAKDLADGLEAFGF